MKPKQNCFFDIHCHAFNLSHLNFSAYLHNLRPRQLIRSRTKAAYVIKIAEYMISRFLLGSKKGSKLGNLVSLMENDVGMFFLLIDHFLKSGNPDIFRPDNTITLHGKSYQKFVLTPLMIDFNYPSTFDRIFYDVPPEKPLAEQYEDLLKGIRDYYAFDLDSNFNKIPAKGKKLFAIHPFLGVNTRNYKTPDEVKQLLDRYFGSYAADKKSAAENPDSQALFFAGIKVYPPLGYDPWPEDSAERAKVELLYDYCTQHGIPITSHCQEMGIDVDARANELVHPDRWRSVLLQPRYFNLKLNLAHFGRQDYWFFPKHEWERKIIALINERPHVYTDIAFRGFNRSYYKRMSQLTSDNPLLADRLLFGSDFLISLIEQNSYNDYLVQFASSTSVLGKDLADRMCSVNPWRFVYE